MARPHQQGPPGKHECWLGWFDLWRGRRRRGGAVCADTLLNDDGLSVWSLCAKALLVRIFFPPIVPRSPPSLVLHFLQELEILFVEQCRDRPMYGSHFFYSLKVQCVPDLLSNLPNNLLLAFNADGMHIFSVDKKELLQQYSYADVHSWRGTRRQVCVLCFCVLRPCFCVWLLTHSCGARAGAHRPRRRVQRPTGYLRLLFFRRRRWRGFPDPPVVSFCGGTRRPTATDAPFALFGKRSFDLAPCPPRSSFQTPEHSTCPAPLFQVSLTIWDQDTDSVFELALKTQQASDMASIILDHINAIMANAGRN